MRPFSLLTIALSLCFQLAASQSSSAIDNPTSARPPKPLKMGPSSLTSGECKGLGGKLAAAPSCDSGIECLTTDADSVIHRACLTKK